MTALAFTVLGRPLTWQHTGGTGGGRGMRFDARGRESRAYTVLVRQHAIAARQRAKLAGITWPLDAEYGVRIVGIWPDRREGDEDRLRSLVYDALQLALYTSDRQVKVNDGGGIGAPDKAHPRLVVAVRVIGPSERAGLVHP